MSENGNSVPFVSGELETLQERLIALADLVESALAESIVALMDNEPGAADDARLEDYRAHSAWLEVDGLCGDLLSSGDLSRQQVRFVHGAVKIAMHLKTMADECLQVSRQEALRPAALPAGPVRESVTAMVQIVQSMLSDSVDALVNSDPLEANGAQQAYPQLDALGRELLEQLIERPGAGKLQQRARMAVLLVGRSLQAIGRHALEVAGHIAQLHPGSGAPDKPPADD